MKVKLNIHYRCIKIFILTSFQPLRTYCDFSLSMSRLIGVHKYNKSTYEQMTSQVSTKNCVILSSKNVNIDKMSLSNLRFDLHSL